MYALDMPRERADQDPVVTAYVIKRLLEWQREGRQFKDLAANGGMPASVPSQVVAGTMGVGAKNRPRFAAAFGFRDEEALRVAAQESWDAEKRSQPLTSAQEEAVAYFVELGQGTREHVMSIMRAFSLERFGDRDATWWIQQIGPELIRDLAALRSEDRNRKTDLRTKAEVRRTKRELERARSAPKHEPTVPRRRAGNA